MIVIYILLAVLLCTATAIISMMVFNLRNNKTLYMVVVAGIVISVILGMTCILYGSIASGNVAELHADYNDLMLYYNTVNYSTNEYVRYDYYDKVMAYNRDFERYQKEATNIWLGGLYPKEWDYGIGLIDFQLHGDNYSG